MPKRIGNIYKDMCKIENIKQAIFDSARGKTKRKNVKNVLNNVNEYANKIQKILLTHTYKSPVYHTRQIYDSRSKKIRNICSTPYFPNQIIFWCIINALKSILTRGMYEWCCGSIPSRGIKQGYRAVRRWLNCDWKNTKYCLKLDIHHFYQNINHEKLINLFEHKIKDKEMIDLLETIINSTSNGIPIGNYTSQWFANFYLEPLDHFIKQNLKVKRYVRYVDDMVLFGNNKKKLHIACKKISDYLKDYGLELKDNYQLFSTKSRSIDFLGFQFFKNHIKLRKRNFLAMYQQYRKIRKLKSKHIKIPLKILQGFMSRCGQLKHCDSYFLKQKLNIPKLKRRISYESKWKYKPTATIFSTPL